jgi:hypothetical protein
MITSNLLQHLGIVNGTVALVTGFVKGKRKGMEFISRIQVLTLGRKKKEEEEEFVPMKLEIPRVHRYTKKTTNKGTETMFWERFSQFPLCLAYATTIHKAQGLTLKEVTVEIGEMFAKGQLYTALSRVKNIKMLKLTLQGEEEEKEEEKEKRMKKSGVDERRDIRKKTALKKGWKICNVSLKEYQEMRNKKK